ncbi:MAG TPA: class I SAM-dependent methyltransferase [Solirubrobacterales bacterium]|nr:class I SAM-dependent methyltransferase [Solirubrobacterales bacterium]
MNIVTWHEVECGGYAADLGLWEEMADATDRPIMELGCGLGRVTLHLAKRGAYLVIGVDREPDLVAAVWERSGVLPGDAELSDVRSFQFATKFGLVIAPMQLIQLLPTSEDRVECLSCVVDSMLPGGRAAFAIIEEMPLPPAGTAAPPLPDVRQIEGWIYSSLPLEPVVGPDTILLRRLRQTVDPNGNMSEEMNEIELTMLTAETLEAEGRGVGLEPAGRREIPATEAHVGSTVVLFEKES